MRAEIRARAGQHGVGALGGVDQVDSSRLSDLATVTALVTSGGSPQSGQAVSFSVLTGPNAGTGGSGTTAADAST